MYRWLAFLTIALLTSLSLPGTPQLQESSTHAQTEGILILNEISPWPSDGVVWVELLNPSDQTVPLADWSVQFLSGYSFTFPEDSPEIVPGGLHLLNISGGNPLNPNGDGCVLVGPDGPVDAVTWGDTEIVTGIGLPHGPPLKSEYEVFSEDQGLYLPDDTIIRIPGSWPPKCDTWIGSEHWVIRAADSASRGAPNPFPKPWLMMPDDGVRTASDFALGVSGAGWTSGVTFQVSTDENFENVIIEETVDNCSLWIDSIEPGTYWWRVKASDSDVWCGHQSFTRLDLDLDEMAAETGNLEGKPDIGSGRLVARAKGGGGGFRLTEILSLGLRHQSQRKDTSMVCMDGCMMTGQYAWDVAHPSGTHGGEHNPKYCVRACLAIVAGQYGNTLSQDRIGYYLFEEAGSASHVAQETGHIGDPYGDLGHGVGVSYADIRLALNWIYNQPSGSSKAWVWWANVFNDPSPAKDSMVEFIDIDRPLIWGHRGHARVIDGYAVILENELIEVNFVHVIDPWFTDTQAAAWFDFNPATDDVFVFPPTTGFPDRSDDPELAMDSDGDGLNDFDETRRLLTDPNNPDSDVDGIHDKEDMLEYLFNPDGWYIPLPRDYDNDGAAKELDPDNDDPRDTSSRDGCEDANSNGFLDANGRETFNFDLADDFDYINPDCLRGFLRWEVIATRHDAEVDMDYHYLEEVRLEPGDISGDEYLHPHHYEHSMDYVDINGSTMTGYDSQDGEVRAKLEFEPETGEYFLTIDSNMPESEYAVTVVAFGFTQVMRTPFLYEFDNDGRWNLGAPKEVNGGLLCEGEWETVSGLNVQGPTKLTWMVWITPPQ